MELSVRRLFLPGGTQSNGPYELHLPIFLQPLGGGCFCPAGRKAPGDAVRIRPPV